jgi:HlyD family secretion protein
MIMIRRLIYSLAGIIIIAALGWALWPKPIAIDSALIDRRTIEVNVEDEGKSRIREIYTVSAPIAGSLLRLNLHPGDKVVEKETVVASIRPAAPPLLDVRARKVAEAAAAAAKAAVDLARAALAQAEAQLVFAIGEEQRAAQLVKNATISERAYEKASLDAAVARMAVESGKANLLVRQRELESAQAALIEDGGNAGLCCIDVKAPATGEVLRVLNESEQVLQAGTPLLEIGDPSELEVVAELLSRDAVLIAPAAPAVIDGWGGMPISAVVDRIDPAATTKVSALGIEEQRVTVVLKITSPRQEWSKLGQGFRVVVRIRVWRGENLVAVPVAALFRQGADWAVFTVVDGKAEVRIVKIGHRNDDYAEVLDGLQEGDRVILHPSDRIVAGVAVVQ